MPRTGAALLDLLWSTIFYCGSIAILIGAWAIVRPLPRLRLRGRGRAVRLVIVAAMAVAAVWTITPGLTTSAPRRSRIDDFAPEFQFREHHEIRIHAPAERVYAAIRAVTANEIALFQTFTWIRRFGRPGPESILNAPERRPILDVAVTGGFLLLADDPPREVVVGAAVIRPRDLRLGGPPTPELFKEIRQPGLAKATMNFLVEPDGPSACRVVTETRVFATDPRTLRRFTGYWRVVYPGSAILRITWLRAVKARAEASP